MAEQHGRLKGLNSQISTSTEPRAFEAALTYIAAMKSPWRWLTIVAIGIVALPAGVASLISSFAFFTPIWLLLFFEKPHLPLPLFLLGPVCWTGFLYFITRFHIWYRNEKRPWSHLKLIQLVLIYEMKLTLLGHTIGIFIPIVSVLTGVSMLNFFESLISVGAHEEKLFKEEADN